MLKISSQRSGRRTWAALVGVLTVLALGASACTSSGGGSNTSPGVTDSSVKVGFVVVDLGELSGQLGFKTVEQGTYDSRVAAIQAVVDAVNANGGLGGRTLEPVFQRYLGAQDAPDYAEAQCRALTQDSEVFAVVMDGQFQNNVRPCYFAAGTTMLDLTLIAQDTQSYEQFAPYFWTPSVPEFSSYLKTELEVLRGSGFFEGSTGVSVVAPDTEVTRRTIDAVVLPTLASFGIPNNGAQYIDSSSIGTLGAGASAALQATEAAGRDRLMVVGGARILPTLFADPLVGTLNARYTISSYDNPSFFVDNQSTFFPERLIGMQGLGYMAALDLRKDPSEPFPDPTRPNEGLCKQIIDGAGAAPPETERENYRVVTQFCDAVILLQQTFNKLQADGATISPESFRDAVWGLGSAWTSAVTPTTGWPSGSYSGVTSARGMFWDETCQIAGNELPGCYRYGTPSTPLVAAAPADPNAPAPAAPTDPNAPAAPADPNAPAAPADPNAPAPAPVDPNAPAPSP